MTHLPGFLMKPAEVKLDFEAFPARNLALTKYFCQLISTGKVFDWKA